MSIKVGVFFGGRSVEHEVSVISALQALPLFDKTKYDAIPVYITKEGQFYVGPDVGEIMAYRDIPALLAKSRRVVGVREGGKLLLMQYPLRRFGGSICGVLDVAFPIVHGTNVEDGALQGYFRTMGVPFAGSDVTASAAGMDKYVMKAVLKDNGLPVLDCRRVYIRSFYKDTDAVVGEVAEAFSWPVIVKPANLGSSVGIGRAGDAAGLREAFEFAFRFADTVLVEPAVFPLREINCAVLGDRESAIASECEEPLTTNAFLGYEDKYAGGGKKSAGGAKGMSSAKRKLPADIPPDLRETIRGLACDAFRALGCSGAARVDFLMNASDGRVWVNELNTIPGSLSFYLWEPVGLPYGELLDRMVGLALKRERENAALTYSFETNILANFSEGGTKGLKR